MRAWYCAQTEPNKEFRARKYLELSGFPAFLPSYLVKNKSRHVSLKLLFKGYVFFSLDDPCYWPRVRTITGIQRVITFSPEDDKQADTPWYSMPSDVASAAIERLKAACLASSMFQKDGKETRTEFYITAGCHVRIKNGPLADLSVQKPLVEWADEDRAKLAIMMFGRKHSIEFFQKDLELIEE